MTRTAPCRGVKREFFGLKFSTQAGLYKAAIAIRDGSDDTFTSNCSELCRILRMGGKLSAFETQTLRLRRVSGSGIGSSYHHLVADLSDGTTIDHVGLKAAVRVIFRG